MDTKKELITNTLIIFIGKVFTQMLSFLLLPLYTAYLSTEEYGTVDMFLSLASLLAPIIILQLDLGLFRVLIEARGNRKESKETTVNVYIFSVFLVAMFDVIYIIVTSVLRVQNREIVLLYINGLIFLNLVLQYFRGIGDNVFYSVLCCCNGFLTIMFNILFVAVLQMGIAGMLGAYAVGEFITICVGAIKIVISNKGVKIKFNFIRIKDILGYSIPLIFNGISWWVMNLSDRLIISYFMGISHNGIYAVSNKFSAAMFSLYSIFNLAWQETVTSKLINNKITEEIKKINEFICEALLYISALLLAIMFIIFPCLVDGNYAEGYNYVPILILAVYFNCLGAQVGGILVALKDSKNIAKTSALGAISNIVINILCINYLGLYAAALSTLMAYLIMFVVRAHRVNRLMRFTLRNYCVPGIMLFVCFVVYYSDNILIKSVNLLGVLVCVIVRYKDLILECGRKVINYFKRG